MDYETIYREHADAYDELVSAEDCDGQLLPALAAIASLDGRTIVDVGAGTGRITRQLLPRAEQVICVEPSAAMLAVAASRLRATGRTNFALHQGSADALPGSRSIPPAACWWLTPGVT